MTNPTRTSTSTSRCGSRAPRGLARARLVVPALLIGLVSATALTAGASPASAATSGSALRAAEGDPCTFDWLCLPGQTPAPTATPSTPATQAPVIPGLPFPTPSTTPTTPAPGGGAGGSTDEKDGGLQLGVGSSASCETSAFPSKNATSNTAKLDYAAALGTCEKAVKAGDADVSVKAAADAGLPTPTDHLTHIDATKLSVEGFAFGGVTTLTTSSGTQKRVMIFTASKAILEGIDQSYPFPGGQVNVQNPGGTAVLQGNVKLYVTSFYSKIFSLIPITFTPDFAPPLVLPSMFFTEVSTDNAYITCDQILLSNAKIPISAK